LGSTTPGRGSAEGPNLSLTLPNLGVDAGDDWATSHGIMCHFLRPGIVAPAPAAGRDLEADTRAA